METILSVDIETIGHLPGVNPMITLATVAYDEYGNMLDIFSMNLNRHGYINNPDTLEWWDKFPDEFELATQNPYDIQEVMQLWKDFVNQYSDIVLMGYNSHYDISFINHYVRTFLPDWTDIRLSCIELRDIITQYHGFERKYSKKRHWPSEWTDDLEYQGTRHLAIFDCIEQAHVYFKFRNTSNINS